MLFDLETKTDRLYKSRIIKDIYGSSNGSTLKLHITHSDLKHNRKIVEPGCHVYYQDTEYTITRCSSPEESRFLEVELDKNPPTENYFLWIHGKVHHDLTAPGHMEGNRLILFITQYDYRYTDFSRVVIFHDGHCWKSRKVLEPSPSTHYINLQVQEVY